MYGKWLDWWLGLISEPAVGQRPLPPGQQAILGWGSRGSLVTLPDSPSHCHLMAAVSLYLIWPTPPASFYVADGWSSPFGQYWSPAGNDKTWFSLPHLTKPPSVWQAASQTPELTQVPRQVCIDVWARTIGNTVVYNTSHFNWCTENGSGTKCFLLEEDAVWILIAFFSLLISHRWAASVWPDH